MSRKTKTVEPAAPAANPGAKLSLVKAALQILSDGRPRSTGEIVKEAVENRLWEPGKGKTPAQTLYSAIARDLASDEPRFAKCAERGRFTVAHS